MLDISPRTRVIGLGNELGNHALHTKSSKCDNIVQRSEKNRTTLNCTAEERGHCVFQTGITSI